MYVTGRLAWVSILGGVLGSATMSGASCLIEETVDPLKKRLVINFGDSLPTGSWNPLQILVHGFAIANDCMIGRMWKSSHKKVEADLFIKRRGGPAKKNNPMWLGNWESPKEKEQFLQRLRDKFKHWRRSLPDDDE